MKLHKAQCTIIIDADNGDLEDFPSTDKTTITFDATDLTLTGWVYQFKKVLAAAGFLEKSINDYLGEQ
jgi:hypothetical protein